jgi:Tol biopolymer transport system component
VPLRGKPRRFGASTDSYGTLSIDARGDRVAYGSAGGPGERVPITVVSVPSGRVVGKIGGPKTDNVFPSLSPDGKHVVFVQATATGLTVLTAAVDGSNLQPLKQCGGEPLWSPIGGKVACPGTGSMSSTLLLVSLRTGKTTTLIPPVGPSDGVRNGRIFGWSANGQRIALLYGRCGCRLDVVDLATGKLRQLLGGAASATDVTWSPNSRQLLVTESDPRASTCDLLWRLQTGSGKRRLVRGCS